MLTEEEQNIDVSLLGWQLEANGWDMSKVDLDLVLMYERAKVAIWQVS